jgi:hypothetical protein
VEEIEIKERGIGNENGMMQGSRSRGGKRERGGETRGWKRQGRI